jgi:hypothetical protein
MQYAVHIPCLRSSNGVLSASTYIPLGEEPVDPGLIHQQSQGAVTETLT